MVGFLQGAYHALRDIEFQQWDDALLTCRSDRFDAWLVERIESPPASLYDEKWATLARTFSRREGVGALASLEKSAMAAAKNGGPYEAILTFMEESISGGLGGASPADQLAFEDALLRIAGTVEPDGARSIADRLVNAGQEDKAASLLPTIFPDRVQEGGGFLYGAVALEVGDCDGEKEAVLHAALLHEDGSRYLLQADAEEAMRTFKPRLAKCEVESPWRVIVRTEPLASSDDLDAYALEIAMEWSAQEYGVKVRVEKDLTL